MEFIGHKHPLMAELSVTCAHHEANVAKPENVAEFKYFGTTV
jgi:hypothetical protein